MCKFVLLGLILIGPACQVYTGHLVTSTDIACVGQLDQKLLFFTYDPNVYEYPLSVLTPYGTLSIIERSGNETSLLKKWPSLASIAESIKDNRLSNMITVRDYSEHTYVVGINKTPNDSQELDLTYFDVNENHPPLFKQVEWKDTPMKTNQIIWISTMESGQFLLLQTEPHYRLTMYEFSDKMHVSLSDSIMPSNEYNDSLNLCQNGTHLNFTAYDCSDGFINVKHEDWKISRGFANNDRVYLFGGTQVRSFDLYAFILPLIVPIIPSHFELPFVDEYDFLPTRLHNVVISDKMKYFPMYLLMTVIMTTVLVFGLYILFLSRKGICCCCLFILCLPGMTRQIWKDPFGFGQTQVNKNEEAQHSKAIKLKINAKSQVSKKPTSKKAKIIPAPPMSNRSKTSSAPVSSGNSSPAKVSTGIAKKHGKPKGSSKSKSKASAKWNPMSTKNFSLDCAKAPCKRSIKANKA